MLHMHIVDPATVKKVHDYYTDTQTHTHKIYSILHQRKRIFVTYISPY